MLLPSPPHHHARTARRKSGWWHQFQTSTVLFPSPKCKQFQICITSGHHTHVLPPITNTLIITLHNHHNHHHKSQLYRMHPRHTRKHNAMGWGGGRLPVSVHGSSFYYASPFESPSSNIVTSTHAVQVGILGIGKPAAKRRKKRVE